MVYTKRRDRESIPAMLRRFGRRVQQSGILLRARKIRFYSSRPSRRARRLAALRRLVKAKERERLAKLGKTPERPKR